MTPHTLIQDLKFNQKQQACWWVKHNISLCYQMPVDRFVIPAGLVMLEQYECPQWAVYTYKSLTENPIPDTYNLPEHQSQKNFGTVIFQNLILDGQLHTYMKVVGSTVLKTAQAYAQFQLNQNYHKYPNTNSRNGKKPGHFQIPRRHSPARHDPRYVTSVLRSNYNNITIIPLEGNFIK